MQEISVLIVDDHKIVRDGIKSLLMDHTHIKIRSEQSNGVDALNFIKANPNIDVVLLDINMPEMSGITCAKKITELKTGTKILALTMLKEEQHIRSMIDAGASGYILKESGEDELVNAIQTVANGNPYYCDEASEAITNQINSPALKGEYNFKIELTDREHEILRLIANEYTNQEIAEKLFISVRTVDAHRRNLMEKIGAKNLAGLVRFAIEKGIIVL